MVYGVMTMQLQAVAEVFIAQFTDKWLEIRLIVGLCQVALKGDFVAEQVIAVLAVQKTELLLIQVPILMP